MKRIRKQPRTNSGKARNGSIDYVAAAPSPEPKQPPKRKKAFRLTKAERNQRIRAAEALLSNGASKDHIHQVLADKFGMGQRAITALITRVYKLWSEDESSQRAHYKRAAIRRIHGHINAARKQGKFGAIASLEGLLARIQGTLDPIRVEVNVEATLRETVLHVMTGLDTERLHELAQRALAYRGDNRPLIAAQPLAIEASDD
jgi:hypothetical protein